MSKNKESGDAGEIEVVNLVPCPNCGKPLMSLPKNYPLYDIQCTGCLFRAQVITNIKWKDKDGIHHEIRFYPFIPKINLKMHQLSPNARRANYKMFNYIGIDEIPFFVLHKE